MQTPKSRTKSLEAGHRISPRSKSSEACQKSSPQATSSEAARKDSPWTVRHLKTSPRYLEPTASFSNLATRAPKERNTGVSDHRSPKSTLSEKKHPDRVADLESQISQLENDLKLAKDQLCSSETSKKQAEKDVEDSKKEQLALSAKLEELQKQILEQSVSEEVLVIEPCETTRDYDHALQSELVALWKQYSHDSAALLYALTEIEQLKAQLDTVAGSEAAERKHSKSAQTELQKLKDSLSETLLAVEEMKQQLKESNQSEAQARELVAETLMQLEMAKKTVQSLSSDREKTTEAYNTMVSELEKSRARVNALEELVSKLKSEIKDVQKYNGGQNEVEMKEENLGESIEMELTSVRHEAQHLRSAMEAAEMKFNEERARSANQVRVAFEMVEQMKSASGQREAELEAELRKSKYEIEELKVNLMDKETELQGICEENEELMVQIENTVSRHREDELETEHQDVKAEIEKLKASLMDKEIELQHVSDENQMLKLEIKEISKTSEEVSSNLVAAKAAEREALMKVGYVTEEVDKSGRKLVRVTEQLEAEQVAYTELETELRRLKVQSDQWRKAAEAAATMLSTGNNGHLIERTGSMDSMYCPRTMRIGPPYADDFDDDLLKKKHTNMLSRFGVLWKKPHK